MCLDSQAFYVASDRECLAMAQDSLDSPPHALEFRTERIQGTNQSRNFLPEKALSVFKGPYEKLVFPEPSANIRLDHCYHANGSTLTVTVPGGQSEVCKVTVESGRLSGTQVCIWGGFLTGRYPMP
jgi:acetyl/propionyl-CoA carboxylase alpha subunit